MSRTNRASASWLGSRVGTGSLVFGVMTASVFGSGVLPGSGVAAADPGGVGSLVAEVANVNQKLQELGASIQGQQEAVNKAIDDVATARDTAATAQHDVDASDAGVRDANAAISAAQGRFDKYAVSAYVNGPAQSYLTSANPADMIATAAAGQAMTISSQKVLADLQRARTEQTNRQSAARLAKQKADQAVQDAQNRQDDAVKALTDAKHTFADQQVQLDALTAQRNAAQAKLAALGRSWSTPSAPNAAPAAPAAPGNYAGNWDGNPAPAMGGGRQWDDGGWDPTLPKIPSANIQGDPVAVINTVLGVTATSAQVTQQMGHSFLQSIGLVPKETYNNGAIPRVYGKQASEFVIRRAMSQIGVPYSWGGGTAAGPSKGIDSGAGTTGFDCSGLILYAFAGVGIKLPHYSGNQYNSGRKIPTSQARRGDVIFYGPGGSQHVTLYLGDGKMLEAPYTGSDVHISPVRTSGMTPYVVRFIEY